MNIINIKYTSYASNKPSANQQKKNTEMKKFKFFKKENNKIMDS